MTQNATPFQKAVSILGGPSAVARELGCTPQAVCFWRDGLRAFPVEHCAVIERVTSGRITRQELRPHDFWRIWPDLAHLKPVDVA